MKIFIPIKRNSQRVEGKNFRDFLGTPLYKRTLLEFSNFEIFVDTDSRELISEISEDPDLKHVKAYMRNESLLGDKVSVCDLVYEWIKRFKIDENVCQIHVTSPFLKSQTVDHAFSILKKGFDSVVSANTIHSRLWRKESYGFCPVNHNPTKLEQTQDLPALYEENSLFYIFNSSSFLKTGMRIGSNPFFYECSFPENIDIDNESDWDQAILIGEKS
mgnify:CR=1 FL=1